MITVKIALKKQTPAEFPNKQVGRTQEQLL